MDVPIVEADMVLARRDDHQGWAQYSLCCIDTLLAAEAWGRSDNDWLEFGADLRVHLGALQVLADHGSAVCREDEFGVSKVALQPAAMNFVSSVVCPAASTPLLKLPCSDVFAHHTHKLDLVLDLHRKDWTAEYDAPHYIIEAPSHIWLAWWPAANYTSHVCMPFSSFTTEASCKCWLPCQRTITSVCPC